MDVGIIGSGSVGSALASGLSAAGHDVVVGSRDPDGTTVEGARVESQRDAATFGDVVVLALPGGVVVDVAVDLRDALAGKPVLDTANEYPTPREGRPLAARVADAVPGARVVKAFNTIGADRMTAPVVDGAAATMFLAGDDADAVETAAGLAADLGFGPVRAGDLSAAAHLEHLARFWIDLSREYGRETAFRYLRA